MLKLRSTQICLRDPQVYTIRQTYRREMDEGLLLGRAPRSVQSLAPSCKWRGSRARFPARDGIFGASFVVGSRACAPPCIPALSFTAVAKVPTGRNLGGGEHARRDRARDCKQLHTGKGRKSGPRRKPSCLMSSGHQPTLWKDAILRAPLI
jgi:hypothetical protein